MIARGARLDPARAGEARGDHAADAAALGRGAEQRRGVDRLEGELLVLGIDQRQHVVERRAGLDGDDQFVGLIGRHRIQRRQIEQRIGRHRLPDRALGAMTDDLQRLLGGNRRPHRVLDVLGIAGFQGVHECILVVGERSRWNPSPLWGGWPNDGDAQHRRKWRPGGGAAGTERGDPHPSRRCATRAPRHPPHKGEGEGRAWHRPDTNSSAQNLGMSGNGSLPPWTCMRPSSAQRCSVGNTLPGLSRPPASNAHFSRC